MAQEMHYADYLQLNKILDAQHPQSALHHNPAHDEMLFIVIHQSYELWFKQLLYEVHSVTQIMHTPSLNDNSPELQTVTHRLARCATILKVLVHQIDVMETMTPMDFLDFRDLLRPASGFQSWQFKLLEARLGLPYQQRFAQQYYLSQLRPSEVEAIQQGESEKSLAQLVNRWLERMPFFDEPDNWINFPQANPQAFDDLDPEALPEGLAGCGPFWWAYRRIYRGSLAAEEKNNLDYFDRIFSNPSLVIEPLAAQSDRMLSPAACRSALFIMLYRGYPALQLPFQLLTQLVEIDEQLSTWRYRHLQMVHRTIGTRIGTGGSSGKDYLKGALDRHYIFKDIAQLSSFLIERRRLPVLSLQMERRLGFAHPGIPS
jgi:tryptophan 2,3-dioxygenase